MFILSIYSTEQVLNESGVSIAPPKRSQSATTTILPPQPNITRLHQCWSDAIKKNEELEDGSDEGGKDEETEDEDEEETEVNKDDKDDKDNKDNNTMNR